MRLSAIAFASAAVVAGCGDASVGTNTFWHGGTSGTPGSSGVTGSAGSASGGGSTPTAGTSGGNGATAGGSGSGSDGSNPSSGSNPGSSSSGSGSGGSAPGGSQSSGSLALTLANVSPEVDLLSSVDVAVNLSATDFTGSVDLSTTGLPSDITATFNNPTVTVGASGGSAMLTLTTLSSTASGPVSFNVVATAGTITGTSSVSLTVNPTITLDIPVNADANQGTDSNPRKDAFGSYPIMIAAPSSFPVTVIFHNADSTPHEIHAGQASEGFPHGAGLIAAGANETPIRHVTAAGTYTWYLHDQGGPTTLGQIVIQ